MKINFKYYKTKSLLLLILGLYIFSVALKKVIAPMMHLPESMGEVLTLAGWLKPMAAISLVFFLINEYLWKYPFMKWLIDIPNLSGRYTGELTSSYIGADNLPVKKDCVIEIKQNASGIHVSTYYADKGSKVQTSKADSFAEEIIKEKNGSFSLHYIFSNEPNTMIDALTKHKGTATFIYYADRKQLDGEYYNSRLNKGTMTLTFEDTKCLHRFAKER